VSATVPVLPKEIALHGFTLRAIGPEHLVPYAAAIAASDAHLRPFTPWVVDGRIPGQSLHDRLVMHAARFDAGEEWVYGLFGPRGDVWGGCGIYTRVGPGAVELGYWLAAGQVGRGLATHATAALTALSFRVLPVNQVQIRCDPRNAASARVPARLGYELLPPDAAHGEGVQVWSLTRDRVEAGVGR